MREHAPPILLLTCGRGRNILTVGVRKPYGRTRDGEGPQMATSPVRYSSKIPEYWPTSTGPRYRSLLCLGGQSWTSSPLQFLNFRGLVWTAGTVLPVLPIPAVDFCSGMRDFLASLAYYEM